MLVDTKWNELLQVNPGQKLVLEIGANLKPQAQFVDQWRGAKVLTLDVDEKLKPDILADAENMPPELYEQLDGLLASHVLEHFSYWKTEKVLSGWVRCLKEGGEIHILVPSLEWAAREVLSENPSPAVYAQLYAGQVNQWDVHLTGFTMRKLRQLMDRVGISTNVARTGIYHVRVGTMGEFEAMQHYVAGVKGTPPLRQT
jgi:predicted SAM-dependent methyltransferase